MVRHQIENRGVTHPGVLDAMRAVPRHEFVLPQDLNRAYEDGPLPIGLGQTISQPYIVALMTELLDPRPSDIVLEIGTGSGYQSAVLSHLVQHVYTVERHPELALTARERLERLGRRNVTVLCGDGYDGWPQFAPYDGILVTAAPPAIPEELYNQIKPGRHIIIPVGAGTQDLLKITMEPDGPVARSITPVRFVPLLRQLPPEV
ncbi:MAG: protein-L-isoaspartate(D-aspartate) O-methyltransferase [Candidatus Sumerlaeia bacterium]